MLKIKRKTKNKIIFTLLAMFVVAAIVVYIVQGLTKLVAFLTLSGMAFFVILFVIQTIRGEGMYTDGIAWYDENSKFLFYYRRDNDKNDDHPISHIHIP